jgi:hypothetical protein
MKWFVAAMLFALPLQGKHSTLHMTATVVPANNVRIDVESDIAIADADIFNVRYHKAYVADEGVVATLDVGGVSLSDETAFASK